MNNAEDTESANISDDSHSGNDEDNEVDQGSTVRSRKPLFFFILLLAIVSIAGSLASSLVFSNTAAAFGLLVLFGASIAILFWISFQQGADTLIEQNDLLNDPEAVRIGQIVATAYAATSGMLMLGFVQVIATNNANYGLQIIAAFAVVIALIPFLESLLSALTEWLPETPLLRGFQHAFCVLKPGRRTGRQSNAAVSTFSVLLTAALVVFVGTTGPKGAAVTMAILLSAVFSTAYVVAWIHEWNDYKEILYDTRNFGIDELDSAYETKEEMQQRAESHLTTTTTTDDSEDRSYNGALMSLPNGRTLSARRMVAIASHARWITALFFGSAAILTWIPTSLSFVYAFAAVSGIAVFAVGISTWRTRAITTPDEQVDGFWLSLAAITATSAGIAVSIGFLTSLPCLGNVYGLEELYAVQAISTIVLFCAVAAIIRTTWLHRARTGNNRVLRKLIIAARAVSNIRFVIFGIASLDELASKQALLEFQQISTQEVANDNAAVNALLSLSRDDFADYRHVLWPLLHSLSAESSTIREHLTPVAMKHCSSEDEYSRGQADLFVQTSLKENPDWEIIVLQLADKLSADSWAEIRIVGASLTKQVVQCGYSPASEHIDRISSQLMDGSWDVRNVASEALELALARDTSLVTGAIARVIELFHKTEFLLHAAAVTTLGRILRVDPTQAEKAIPILEQMAQSDDRDVRSKAADALAEVVDANPDTGPKLIDTIALLAVDPQYEVRSAVAESMRVLLNKHPSLVIELSKPLRTLAADHEATVRTAALRALSETFRAHEDLIPQSEEVIKVLATASAPKVRAQALDAMSRGASENEELLALTLQTLTNLEDENSTEILTAATNAIIRMLEIDSSYGMGLLETALELSEHSNYTVRHRSLHAVAKIADEFVLHPNAVTAMIAKLADDPDHEIRMTLASFLSKLAINDKWLEAIESTSPPSSEDEEGEREGEREREQQQVPTTSVSTAIVVLLGDPDQEVRTHTQKLVETIEPAFKSTLTQRAREFIVTESPGTRMRALRAAIPFFELGLLDEHYAEALSIGIYDRASEVSNEAYSSSRHILLHPDLSHIHTPKWEEALIKGWSGARAEAKRTATLLLMDLVQAGDPHAARSARLVNSILETAEDGESKERLLKVRKFIDGVDIDLSQFYEAPEQLDILGLPLTGYKKEGTFKKIYVDEGDDDEMYVIDEIDDSDPTVYIFDEVAEEEDDEDYDEDEEDYDEDEDYEDDS